jgi:very-short-patch-repair endonuclease
MERRHRIHPVLRNRAREMRHPQTPAEAALWRALRSRNLKYKFRRQHPIENFIADFYCAQARLFIEIDGSSHFEAAQKEYDLARTAVLEELGYKVIRFTNDYVRDNLDAVVEKIVRKNETLVNPPSPEQSEGSIARQRLDPCSATGM